jgi:hypothetical protein
MIPAIPEEGLFQPEFQPFTGSQKGRQWQPKAGSKTGSANAEIAFFVIQAHGIRFHFNFRCAEVVLTRTPQGVAFNTLYDQFRAAGFRLNDILGFKHIFSSVFNDVVMMEKRARRPHSRAILAKHGSEAILKVNVIQTGGKHDHS